jgi:hypothetical protein
MSDAFATVWRPGSGAQWVRSGMSGDEFKTQDTTYFAQGLRISSLAIKDGWLAAVWQPGSGTQWVHWGMSGDEFKTQDMTDHAQGLRVTELVARNGRLSAVWRPGSGTQWIRWGMSGDEFKAQDLTYFDQGLRITALAVDNGRIAAVWRPGSGTQWVRWGMSGDEFKAQDKTYFAQGLRISSLTSDRGKYAAVWRPGSGTQWWSSRRGVVDFKTEDAAYFRQGLRIARLDVSDDPSGAYRYPWKVGVPCKVGQGNNNASGSHNGSQAWAFDFSLPAGTEIRAARDGTVEWLQENLTASYNPTKADGPGNMPFPAGSLQNWGNAVRIRHAGGFTSWYFHIQTNGVLVKENDVVTQGQAIALSDNTGRTSGAHLHFQVQADSLNWGPSVPCTFGANCEQPSTGDIVISDNGL